MPPRINMIGSKFSRLTVISQYGNDKRGEILWMCDCDCGGKVIALGGNLRSGGTKSCGCFNNDRIANLNRRHDMSNTRMFRIWVGIRKRCTNPNSKSYEDYGGRGITICERWDSYENFYEDMKQGYDSNLTLEREDVNGNYEPSNCTWSTPKEQARNKRNSRYIEHNGESLTAGGVGRKSWRERNYNLMEDKERVGCK